MRCTWTIRRDTPLGRAKLRPCCRRSNTRIKAGPLVEIRPYWEMISRQWQSNAYMLVQFFQRRPARASCLVVTNMRSKGAICHEMYQTNGAIIF